MSESTAASASSLHETSTDTNGHTVPDTTGLDISSLSAVALAMLVSFVASHHLIIRTPNKHLLSSAQTSIEDAARETFGFTVATVHCSASTTLEDFVETILVGEATQLDSRKVANVVIAKELDLTGRNLQILALEVSEFRHP